MAFPTGWTGCAFVSLPAPTATVTNFTYPVSLNGMPAEWWAAVKSDGGDIRASTGLTHTELPTDLVEFDYANQTGLLMVLFSGTKSAAVSEVLRIWCGKSDESRPAASDTYGQYNAYVSSAKAFYPSGGGNDRTVNANHLTMYGSPTVGGATGPISGCKATAYDGSTQYGQATASVPTSLPITFIGSASCSYTSSTSRAMIVATVSDTGSANHSMDLRWLGGSSRQIQTVVRSNAVLDAAQTSGYTENTYHRAVAMFSSTTSRWSKKHTSTPVQSTTAVDAPSSLDSIAIGALVRDTVVAHFPGNISAVFIYAGVFSNDWLDYDASAFSNQSTFYGTWKWQTDPDLVGHWKLDDNAENTTIAATYGGNGSLTGAGNTSASRVTGPGGSILYGLSLDGSDDYISLTTNNAGILKNVAESTLAIWCKTSATPTGNDAMIWVGTNSTPSQTIRHLLGFNPSRKVLAGGRSTDAESSSTKSSDSTGFLDGNWHHFASVIDLPNDTVTIYVDGTAVAATGTINFSAGVTANTNSTDVTIGGLASSLVTLNGHVADARIYRRALSQSEIATLYAMGVTQSFKPAWARNSNVLLGMH